MMLDKLIPCYIIKRYKRFLVDVLLEDKTVVTAHCPNSGSMKGLATEGLKAYISAVNKVKNKLKYKLELIQDPQTNSLVGINTSLTNHIVNEALMNKKILELSEYEEIKPEVKFENSRFDFQLNNKGKICYLEVKNVTLRENSLALFPDAVTARGNKHLQCLIQAKKLGFRAVNLYVIQRTDVDKFDIAKNIDPKYWESFNQAKHCGVEMLAYNCNLSLDNISLNQKINIL